MSTENNNADGRWNTPLTEALGCRYPIIQTAMGWVSDANLVIATTRAGGFGFLAGATMGSEEVEDQIKKVIAATGTSNFGLNFHMFQENAQQCLDLAIEYKLKAVSYGRGPDQATIARLKAAGVLCIPTVGAVKHAVKAVELGADMVTIQGSEGGGHTGSVPSSILLPQVLNAVSVPVIAAGGFSCGRGLASVLGAGAAGMAMGTRFLLTSDAPTPKITQQRYIDTKDSADIRISTAVDGMRHRMINTPFIDELERSGGIKRLWIALCSARQWQKETGMTYLHMLKVFFRGLREDPKAAATLIMSANQPVLIQKSMVDGNPDAGILPSGQVAAVIDDLPSVETLINEIITEADNCLEQLITRRNNRLAQ
ncbi:nitronate monooxygenase [Colwellia sp. PAMC 21821]|uniref:NAD(P)H-dependent flavin oxidoreductase n=1 Tax=Colwellia sp. PAMC 21821 TaxID=1816219 RepID=UPI0009C12803|nr:nitronate monooxygenase [Colwellia sp. PAMC 21821]ARD46130.1 2-nitropropane dioxygenase [Colwellia sp. PAMC 21821]